MHAYFKCMFEAWRAVEETTLTGVSGSALRVYYKLIKPLEPVLNYHMLVEKSKTDWERPLSTATLRKYVAALQEVGLVDVEPDPEDKRRKVIRVIGAERKMWKNEVSEFQAYFKLENLKDWWNRLQKLCEKPPLIIIPAEAEGNLKSEDEKLAYIYQKLCSINEGVFWNTILKPEIVPKSGKEA